MPKNRPKSPRTVFITGASSGIGRALALEYASRGAKVAIAARRVHELERVAKEIEGKAGAALILPLDVTDDAAVNDALHHADREFGGLDMVIANAGIGISAHASTLQWNDVARVLDVNVKGALATLVAAIPIMLAHQGGHLVGISSLAGRRGLPGLGAYSASKAALTAFLETLRLDLAVANIRVTDVQPGYVDTPMVASHKHALPFLWSLWSMDKAARVIARRLERGPAMIAFPWPLATVTAVARHLPARVYDSIIRLAQPRERVRGT